MAEFDLEGWQEAYDEATEAVYYFNETTGDCTWDVPEPVRRYKEYQAQHAATDDTSAANSPAEPPAGPAPQPNLFNLARASVTMEKRIEDEMKKEVSYIRREYVEFERNRQAELQRQIDELNQKLNQEVTKTSDDMSSVINSLKKLTEQDEEKLAEEQTGVSNEKLIGRVWQAAEETMGMGTAALKMERERQSENAKERLERARLRVIRKRQAEVAKELEKKWASAAGKIKQVEKKFSNMQTMLRVEVKMRHLGENAKTRIATMRMGTDTFAVKAKESVCPWVKIIDDTSGYPYYYNAVTGASQWEVPEDYVDDEDGGNAEARDKQAISVADEWVTEDLYELEKQKTADLEREIEELDKKLEEAKEASAFGALAMIEQLINLDEEETEEDKIESVNKMFERQAEQLGSSLTKERERQRGRMLDRLAQRRQVLTQKRKQSLDKSLETAKSAAQRTMAQVREDAARTQELRRKLKAGFKGARFMVKVMRAVAK